MIAQAARIAGALGQDRAAAAEGEGALPSCFAVSDLAAASVGAVGVAVADLVAALGLAPEPPAATVDRRLASLWFARSIHPLGWKLPPVWDPLAGDYRGADGWIKLHTNLSHHREAALAVLGCAAGRGAVAAAVQAWPVDRLEDEIVAAGGAAAAMRSAAAWRDHGQGAAVAAEPLVGWGEPASARLARLAPTRARPLAGLRVLDLTRVLAGPVATRTLAAFGAEVLRIDRPGWEEPNVVPDVTLGKNCARLDLGDSDGRALFEGLLAGADLLVHGYRPGALAALGYGEEQRRALAPGLIEVSLDAYGWTGPWRGRRGFDSLVQMSCGIAEAGMRAAGATAPVPLPVQALDHATGYLMAAAALTSIATAARDGAARPARLSLARTAALLIGHRQEEPGTLALEPGPDDFSAAVEATPWGEARRLKPPLAVEGTPMAWAKPAAALGSSPAAWDKSRSVRRSSQ